MNAPVGNRQTHLRVTPIAAAIGLLFLAGCSDNSAMNEPSEALTDIVAEHQHEDTAAQQPQSAGLLPRSAAPDDARVFFISPQDGDTVSNPVTFEFGVENMTVVAAGVQQEHSGHHHLLINLDELPAMDVTLPATEQIVHFGAGQTEAELELPAGTHQLQLLLGDHFHVPHNPPVMSDVITITVE